MGNTTISWLLVMTLGRQTLLLSLMHQTGLWKGKSILICLALKTNSFGYEATQVAEFLLGGRNFMLNVGVSSQFQQYRQRHSKGARGI